MAAGPTSCPTAEVLESLALGASATEPVQAHVNACPACRSALQSIQANNSFLAEFVRDGALPPVPAAADAELARIPGYDIVREIHRGGQGVVYLAVQRATRRDVAIKVMRQGPFATIADRGRFEREIETLGRLNHANIVAVHDAGVTAGVHYFVMNYVEGRPLDEYARNLPPAPGTEPTRRIIELFATVCEAVHAAHLQGVIHRDLKPSNIRIDRAGSPHVLDFGLAKPVQPNAGETAMTYTGQFVGSLPWASPEQIEGVSARIDLRTDVYSLGVILFQLLTGALPFDVGSNLHDAIDSILFRDPPRPSTRNTAAGGPRIDEELDTIVLKCLAKDRARRYQTAGELARDLRHYLAGEAIEAKRDSALYVLRKTLRRYRLPVAVAAAFVVLLGVFGVVMAVLYRRSVQLEHSATRSAVSLSQMLSQSNIEQGRLAGILGNLAQAEQLLWGEMLLRRQAGADRIVGLHDPPGPTQAHWALWELYRQQPCLRSLMPAPAILRTLYPAADRQSVWTTDLTGLVQRVDTAGRVRDSFRCAARGTLPIVSPDGRYVLVPQAGQWSLWRRDGSAPILELPTVVHIELGGLSFARSSRYLACNSDGWAIVWQVEPVEEVARFGPPERYDSVALSPDDRLVAARDQNGAVHVWELATRERVALAAGPVPQRELLREGGELCFSDDGRWLADAWIVSPARVWDLHEQPPRAIDLGEPPALYRMQAFSPDGRSLAIGDMGGALRIFNLEPTRLVASYPAHAGRIRGVAYTDGGSRIWTSGGSELRVWESQRDGAARIVPIPNEVFHTVDFALAGRKLVAGGGLGRLHWIDTADLSVTSTEFGNAATISALAVSADQRYLATGTYAHDAAIWDLARPAGPVRVLTHPQRISYVAFDAESQLLATACEDQVVRVWRVDDGTLLRELRDGTTRVPQVAFDPAGARLAAVLRDGTLMIWDLASGARTTKIGASDSILRALRFSPDGRWIYTAGAARAVDIWDAASGRKVGSFVGHNQEIYCLDVAPDGRLIASGDSGGAIRLWDVELRVPLVTLDGHAGSVMALRFAPDGRSVVSVSLDGTLRLWDLSYYERHIAGNVEFQLGNCNADQTDPAAAARWRAWANQREP